MSRELKPCPFCGGTDIQYSIKTTGGYKRQYHASMFCNTCHCYGARILYQVPNKDYSRYLVENDTELHEKAIEAWNRRVEEGADNDNL